MITDERLQRVRGIMMLLQAENERRFNLYRQGKTDKEMAAELGVSKSTIQMWRKKNRLSANGRK
ncbi:MAG: helix-turn-helix domain-containing protein [Smithella sp.]